MADRFKFAEVRQQVIETAEEEDTRMDRIPKLRLPKKLTGRQTVFISGARNFWSSWKIDGSLALLQSR